MRDVRLAHVCRRRPGLHQLQAEVSQGQRSLSIRTVAELDWQSKPGWPRSLRVDLTKQFQLQEHERQARIAQHRAAVFPPGRGMRYSHLSLEKFRTAPKYHDRPAAADIAFCVAAYSLGMPDDAMANTLDSEYLSRDPNPARKAAYIRRTMAKARVWANR